MKKLIFLLFILSAALFAQDKTVTKISGITPKDDDKKQSSILVQKNPDSTFSLYHYIYTSVNDTLDGVDSTTYNYGNRPYNGFINVYNNKSNADTISIYYYDVPNARWTSAMSALIDQSTTHPVSNNLEIIIPANTVKRYRIYEQYPEQVKIKVVGTTGQAADQLIITFIEKN